MVLQNILQPSLKKIICQFKTRFIYRDRIEAGLLLAEKLGKYKNDPGIVLAVPRDGVKRNLLWL